MRALASLASVAAVGLLTLSACSGGDDPAPSADSSPADVLAAAKTSLDETSGVHITLVTSDLPDGEEGLLSADGQATHAPAFDGEITVRYAGFEPKVPVVAVDGKVYAQVPLTTGWSVIDPAEYGAPDPASLLDPDSGFSSLLTETSDVAEGDQQRSEADPSVVVTTYTGTLSGDSVARILPSATGDFDATYSVTDDGELSGMVLTGAFYGGDSMTYTIGFDDYGSSPDITAPE